MDTYKIVNADELDTGLKNIADSLRTVRGESATEEYTFPTTYEDKIADLHYGNGTLGNPTDTFTVTPGAISFNTSTGEISVAASAEESKTATIPMAKDGYVSGNNNVTIKVKTNSTSNSSLISVKTISNISIAYDSKAETYTITMPAGYYGAQTDIDITSRVTTT